MSEAKKTFKDNYLTGLLSLILVTLVALILAFFYFQNKQFSKSNNPTPTPAPRLIYFDNLGENPTREQVCHQIDAEIHQGIDYYFTIQRTPTCEIGGQGPSQVKMVYKVKKTLSQQNINQLYDYYKEQKLGGVLGNDGGITGFMTQDSYFKIAYMGNSNELLVYGERRAEWKR